MRWYSQPREAKQSLAAGRRANASAQRHRELLMSFIAACRRGDVDDLARLLADDVESRGDGGGYVAAATRPVTGVRAVSRLYAGLSRQIPPELQVRLESVNGWPSALLSAATCCSRCSRSRWWTTSSCGSTTS